MVKATNKWMSDGLCYDTCTGSAFAIVQDSNCWCSDYVPDESTQTDTGDCNTSCPGYPDDTCGGDGLYGYMDLGQSPSGTKGASTSTTKATSTTQVSVRRFALVFLFLPSTPGTGSRQISQGSPMPRGVFW